MKLVNKSYKTYDKLSRYESFPVYQDSDTGKSLYGVTSYLDNTTAYTLHTTSRGDTLDSLALYYYGNPTYFWIIADFNRILDCFIHLPEGVDIKIPSISSIRYILS